MTQTINANTDHVTTLEHNLDLAEFTSILENVQRLAGIGMLTTGIADELASLLSIVSTASISLRHELQQRAEVQDDAVQLYLGLLERNAFRASQIVMMLHGYGTLDAPQMASTDIETILRDVLTLVDRQFREESCIQVKVEVSAEVPSLICDHKRIVQLLVNLLLNEKDSLQDSGGVLEVTVKAVHRSHLKNGNGLSASATDGIERIAIAISGKETADELEGFSGPKVTQSVDGSSNGLGLSVAQEIVRQHHGEIVFAKSRDSGKGASVSVILPVRPIL
jgi:signal transduction histidine kinase